MPPFDYDDVPNWRGLTVIDLDGDPVGTITDIYVDDVTGRPEWATVNTGLFGSRTTFVPLAQAELRERRVWVPFGRAFIKDAPNIDVDGHLEAAEEASLYGHYGLDHAAPPPTGAPLGTTGTTGTTGASSQFVAPATEGVDAESGGGRGLRLRRHVIDHVERFDEDDSGRVRDL
jgi:hypothetical protein